MCTVGMAAGMGALSAFANYQQNKSQAASYDSQAAAYSNQAHQQIQEGASQAYQQVRQARSAASSQDAAIGANGVVSSSGSALKTLQDTFQQGQDASDMVQKNAYNQATNTQYQGNIARASAKSLRKNNLGTSLLTGVSTFGSLGGFNKASYAGIGWGGI